MGDVPEVIHGEIEGGLTIEIDDELDDPGAKAETHDKEDDSEGVEADDEAIFPWGQSGADKSEEVVAEEGKGKNESSQQTGVDRQVDELVGGGEDKVDALHFEEMHDEAEDLLIVDKTENSSSKEDTKNGKQFGLQFLEVRGVFEDSGVEGGELGWFDFV